MHRTGTVQPADVEHRHDLPRTRPARTLVDLAGVVDRPQLELAVDDALSRRLVTCDYLERRLDASGRQGRKGAGLFAAVLADPLAATRSTRARSSAGCSPSSRAARLPLPATQYEVRLPSGRAAVLDYAYPQRLLALEADSYRHHSSRLDWARDHTRNRLLMAMAGGSSPSRGTTWGPRQPPT